MHYKVDYFRMTFTEYLVTLLGYFHFSPTTVSWVKFLLAACRIPIWLSVLGIFLVIPDSVHSYKALGVSVLISDFSRIIFV